jgi:hypothetical protein
MNCAPPRSPSKSIGSPARTFLNPRSWSRLVAVAIIGLLSICTAFASPGTLVAPGVNQPNGAIVWNGSVWIADVARGFCRIDAGALNPATCFASANGQPELYVVGGVGTVFITDQTGATGVWRLTMSAVGSTIAASTVLAPNAGLAANQPMSASLGPDGKLYICFNVNGDIKRITNPFGAAQTVESVGKAASGGGPVRSVTFVNGDLYLADTGAIGLERIGLASTCKGGCNAVSMFGVLGVSNSVTSDRVRYLYMENGTRVLRYDTQTTNTVVIFSQNAVVGGVILGYGTIWGVSYDQPTGDVYIGGDPTPPGAATTQIGSLYDVIAPAVTEGAVNTLNGPPAPVPPPSPTPAPAKTGNLYASGITQPRGLNWIATHAWVSDAVSGFCRIDPGAPGVAALSNCFKPSLTFAPGQATYDPVTNMIYVPDANTASLGIFRISFIPGTETLGAALNLGSGGLQPTATAVGLDGALYFGTRTSGNINKITTPAVAPSAPVKIANTSNGKGVNAMAFVGNDLYLAEQVNVTVIIRASPSLAKGTAVIVGPAAARGATPLLNVANPVSLTVDASVPSHPILYIGSDPLGLGSFGQVDQWDILLQTDTLWANSGNIGAVLTTFAYPAGLAFAPGATLYVADDPSVTSAGTTATPGQGHVYSVQ